MAYRIEGQACLADLFGDVIVYRNLAPADPRLPDASVLQACFGLPRGPLPRKHEPRYGWIVGEMLRYARKLGQPAGVIRELLYLGDTMMSDASAFRNICAAGGWKGWAFIGRDEPGQPPQGKMTDSVFVANRWSLLPDFLRSAAGAGCSLGPDTALVIDVDKTAIGARGRNDKVIDAARVEGVRQTVADLLGPRFDEARFLEAYRELNQPAYHAFTADNQDYLAYICLMVSAGLFKYPALLDQIKGGEIEGFAALIGQVQQRQDELAPTGLAPVHAEVWQCFSAGDPTPFKMFRHNEYRTTAELFGGDPSVPPERQLAERIVITGEVMAFVQELRRRGALMFGLSDKPDEAAVPTPMQRQAGMKSLHHLTTLVVSADLT